MKRLLLILAVVMFQGQKSEAQLLQYEGVSYFINGINIPWHKFNLDFGTHYIYGANYDPVYFDSVFTQCQNNGVNCVRIWLHNDGGTTPEFDASGYVTGLDPNFFPNLDDFFQRAQNHNLMVIPSIWDFSMCNNDSAWGKYGGMHANLIQDTTRTRSYINNALIPMVTRYTNQCNLLAWEVMNEPEWVTDVSGNNANITQHVHLNEMQRFIGMLAEAIHQHSSKMVTVGSASIKYNSDKYDVLNLALCVGNLWKDAAVQAAYNKPQAFLDFYCPHYYDWMKTSFQNFSPYDHNTAYWGFDKPVIIEETPCLSSKYTSGGMLYNAVQDSYAGNMFWSFYDGPGSPNGNFNNVKSDLLTYRNTFPSAIDFQGCSVMAVPDDPIMEEHLLIYPNPSSGEFALKFSGKIISIEIVNVAGETVYKSEILINNTHLNLMNQVPGIYFIRMTTAEGVSIKKIVLTKG